MGRLTGIDTVLLAMADMQGRLQGKRLAATHFLDDVLDHNAEGCNYLLAVDVDMNTVDGYAMSSWDRGYGDFVFRPDLATLRLVPWQEGTALVMCDLEWEDGSPVLASPRGVLKRQLERLTERGFVAYAGTELEFIVFRDSYEEAWAKAYRDLRPANDYNVDYSLLGTARIEPLLRRIRNSMAGAGLRVESAKGECNYGQHEIAFRYTDALATADGHVIYKNGAKEIAAQDGCSLTFMSKYNEREGNSCHIHFSLRSADGDSAVMAGDRRHHGYSELMEQFLAGQLACLRELTLFLAPNVNSYKRYAAGSFAPTAVAWGHDNRTCALRVVGHGHSLRLENRVPGGDVTAYVERTVGRATWRYRARVLLHGFVQDAAVSDGRVDNLTVATKAGLRSLSGKVVVDASGDADVCHHAGFSYDLAGGCYEETDYDPDENELDYLVSARDLRTMVEELWAAGAEAIAVNGERITPTTAIIDIGPSILVNAAYLAGPYQVTAIGPADLYPRLGAAPGVSVEVPIFRHRLGLPGDVHENELEALLLRPGPHLAQGGHTIPVVRTMMNVAAMVVAHLLGDEPLLPLLFDGGINDFLDHGRRDDQQPVVVALVEDRDHVVVGELRRRPHHGYGTRTRRARRRIEGSRGWLHQCGDGAQDRFDLVRLRQAMSAALDDVHLHVR